jgi:RHS repeat-associated protein
VWGTSSDAQPEGLQLGYRGEVQFEGDIWLRNRIYEPRTREFLTPDPLPPVAGTSCAANPYHYAANNPIGLLDPLGLRPLTDRELRDISERMGRPPGWLVALTGSWTGLGVDLASSTLYGVSPWMEAAYATRVSGYYRAGGSVRGHWRTTPSGRQVWIAPTERSGGWVSGYLRGNPTTQAWRRAGRLAGPLGTIFSGTAGGADQYAEDFDNRKLSTTDRVGRTAGAAGMSAGFSWGGAEAGGALGLRGGTALGAAIGSAVPGVGTAIGGAVGGTVGAVGGAVVGSGAGSWAADQLSGASAAAGQWVAGRTADALNAAGHAFDDTAGRAKDASASAFKAITPF